MRRETIAVLLPGRVKDPKDAKDDIQAREVKEIAIDTSGDLALLKLNGATLPPLKIRDSDSVRAGQDVLFTGFPIGAVLGPFPATHRKAWCPSVTPIADSRKRARPSSSRRRYADFTSGSFPVLQLDATAYPGSSGSPVYDPDTGEVIGIINMVLVKSTKESALSQPSRDHLRRAVAPFAGALGKRALALEGNSALQARQH